MIAQALSLHEITIVRHIDYFTSKNKLKPKNGGSRPYLNQKQAKQVVIHITKETYRYSYKIVKYIWTNNGVRFSISGLNKWLHRRVLTINNRKVLRRRTSAFFTVTLSDIAETLDSWINDNFQVLKTVF